MLFTEIFNFSQFSNPVHLSAYQYIRHEDKLKASLFLREGVEQGLDEA